MTIREIYKNSEQFLNKEVKLGGWIKSIVVQSILDFWFLMMVHFLNRFRLYMIRRNWTTFRRFPK